MGSMKKASSRIKGMKKCPDCKGKGQCSPCNGIGVCKTCDGHKVVRIVQGNIKGDTFERDIAKEVSYWTGMEFKRTPMSGGWAKTGDITPKNPKHMVKFPFNMELKNQEIFSVTQLMGMAMTDTWPKHIRAWWKQCIDDAKKSKRTPLLLMTKAHEHIYLMMRKKDFKAMGLMSCATVMIRPNGFRIMLWSDFLKQPYDKTLKAIGDAKFKGDYNAFSKDYERKEREFERRKQRCNSRTKQKRRNH